MFTLGVLTLSDKGSKGERVDESGKLIADMLSSIGARVLKREVMPDERDLIAGKLREWADSGDVDIIVTTGGTGLSPRDVTPEATLSVIDRQVPGLVEMMRAEGVKKTPMAMLSRAVSGLRGRCLIINLPGNPKAVREDLEVITPVLYHAVEIMRGEAGECASRTDLAGARTRHAH
ncbi:MAG: putative molybdenum cofactor biosynthesis protein [Dehalococcoidia bacterium]|nr:putative molybdenum cofactor biosynthesis protein [Dehalococcoidia bacterium]